MQELQRQLKDKGGGKSSGKTHKDKKKHHDGTPIVEEKKVYKTVEVWSGVKEKDVNELKIKAKQAQEALENLHKQDEIKYKSAIEAAEQSAKQAESELKDAEENLLAERNELNKLQDLLQEKQAKLMKGGKELDQAKQQEIELQQAEAELQAKLQEKEKLSKKLDFFEESELYMNEQFSSIQEEIIGKTKKLKLLFKKYNEKKDEKQDVIDENTQEEIELTDNIRVLTRQFQLKSLILEYFIPPKWLDFIEENSEWDHNIDQWRIPALEFAGNNMMQAKLDELETQKAIEEQLVEESLSKYFQQSTPSHRDRNHISNSRVHSHNSRRSQSGSHSTSGHGGLDGSSNHHNSYRARPITGQRLEAIFSKMRKSLLVTDSSELPMQLLRNFVSHHELTQELQNAFVIALQTNEDSNVCATTMTC